MAAVDLINKPCFVVRFGLRRKYMNHLKQILRKIDKLLDRKEIPAFIVGALFGVIIVEVEAIERQFIDDKRLCSEFFSPRDRLPKSEFG